MSRRSRLPRSTASGKRNRRGSTSVSFEGLYCDGKLRLEIEESEVRMSHWVNAPRLIMALTGDVLFDLTQSLWDIENAQETDGVLLLTLREYPGTHGSATLAVDPRSGALSVGAKQVARNELQKALRAQRA